MATADARAGGIFGRRFRDSDGPVAGLFVCLAFFVSAAVLSARHTDPLNSAESAFLGLLVTVILCALVFVDRAPQWAVAGTALLATLALWALPKGEARGAAVSLVLVSGLALAICRQTPVSGQSALARTSVALAVSAQAVFRPEVWLAPVWDPAFLSTAVLLPTLAGLATAELSRQRGTTLCLGVALAVALQRGVSPELALVLMLCSLASSLLERRKSSWLWAAGVLAILISSLSELALLFDPSREWRQAISGLVWIPLLAPTVLEPGRDRAPAVAAALGLALAGLWLLPARVALIIPLLVLFDRLSRHSVAGRTQMTWSIALIFGSALTAGYPWLRPRPVESSLAILDLHVGWQSAFIVVVIFWSLVVAERTVRRSRWNQNWRPWRALAPGATVALGLLTAVWPTYQNLVDAPFVLSASNPSRSVAVRGPIASLFVDSYVSHGVTVGPGTPIAVITLEGRDGTSWKQELRAGVDTGEWAANRSGVSVVTPEPWISWLAPDGPYFAQRYRQRWRLEHPVEVTRIRLTRGDRLPSELEIAIFQIGAKP